MAKKSDEEYHFSEPETPVSYTTESSVPKKDKDFQTHARRRNLIFMFAILMVFWAIYKFMGLLFSQVKDTHPKQALQSPVPKVQPIQPSVSAGQLEEMANQKGRLNTLESQMVNFQAALSDMNTKLNDLSTQVSRLADQVNKPAPPPMVVRKKWHPPKNSTGRRKYRSYVYSYQLQAALPGRAWIMREDGTTFTVSLGEKIPDYGTVTSIDPDKGVVQTCSGATIKYITQ